MWICEKIKLDLQKKKQAKIHKCDPAYRQPAVSLFKLDSTVDRQRSNIKLSAFAVLWSVVLSIRDTGKYKRNAPTPFHRLQGE